MKKNSNNVIFFLSLHSLKKTELGNWKLKIRNIENNDKKNIINFIYV